MKPSPITRHLVGGLAAYALLTGAAAAQEPAPAAPAATGKPANLCQELVAFVKQPEAANKAAVTPQQQATAVSNPSGKTEGAKPADGGEPQKNSGLSGAINENSGGPAPGTATARPTANPTGNPATNPNAQANAAAKVPPPPATPAPAPKPDAATVEKIEAAAGANDLAACRDAARSMRVAGVALPPPLLALAALDLKFYEQ